MNSGSWTNHNSVCYFKFALPQQLTAPSA